MTYTESQPPEITLPEVHPPEPEMQPKSKDPDLGPSSIPSPGRSE